MAKNAIAIKVGVRKQKSVKSPAYGKYFSLSHPLLHLISNPKDPLVTIIRKRLGIWQIYANIRR